MNESTGLWKTVPYCIHCKGEEDRIEALKVEEKKRGIEKGATRETSRVFELNKKSQKAHTRAVARNDSPLYLKSFEDYKSRQR
jgi:hypothetical protein